MFESRQWAWISLFQKSRPAMGPTRGFRVSFSRGKAAEKWSWSLTFIYCRGSEWVEPYRYYPYTPSCSGQGQLYLHGTEICSVILRHIPLHSFTRKVKWFITYQDIPVFPEFVTMTKGHGELRSYVVGSKRFRPDQLFKVTEIKQLLLFLTAIGLTPGGSSTVHRTTQ